MTSDLSLIIAFTLVGLLLAILVWLFVARRHLQRAYSQLQQQFQQQGFNHQASLDQQKFETQLSQQQQQQLNSQLTELAQAHQSLQSKFSELQTNYQQILTENQVLQASQLEERKAQQEKLQLLSESKQSLKLEFENLANQLLDKKSASLKAKQEEFFAQSLLPLREQLQEFRTRIDKVYESESRDRLNLVNELHQLKALNQKMSDDAINLTNALKGSQKFQGNWGELILERVLESSGLRNGYEYELQASRKGVDGKTYLPDVIVQLPDDKQLIIDAKVSLLDYQRYIEADDSAEKKLALNQHIVSLKTHIKGLSNKRYEDLAGVNTLDFVFLFVPIEAAFLLALESQPEIFQQAYDKQVIVVSPTTLLATLRTVENMWRFQRQNQNAETIAKQAGALYDQCILVAESMEDVGKAIDKSAEAYQMARKRLVDGRGNVLKRIDSIKKLGAKTKKQLPENLRQELEQQSAQLDDASDSV